MLYRAVRPLLFALEPETAHRLSLKSLDVLTRLGAASLVAAPAPRVPVRVMGLDFPNPVGLAAGLDKDGEHIDALAALGFGFIEVGAVTPRAQPGNPKKRSSIAWVSTAAAPMSSRRTSAARATAASSA